MRKSNQIVLASQSPDKLTEFRALFKAYPEIEIIPASKLVRNASKLGSVEIHATYLENATAKARLANQACHFPCIADDSGLEIDALNGAPGIMSRRYTKPGPSQDLANLEKVLTELKGYPMEKRKARFVATLVLVMEGISLHATGILEGVIAEAPAGENGFGYDPIFIPSGESKTLAELPDSEKNATSHRAKALQALMTEIKARGILFAKP